MSFISYVVINCVWAAIGISNLYVHDVLTYSVRFNLIYCFGVITNVNYRMITVNNNVPASFFSYSVHRRSSRKA